MLALLPLLLACARSPEAIAPPPADDLVYFVMVDRFADGDPKTPGEVDPADPAAFHGGDLKGIVKNLDYLQGLGVRTLWLSPLSPMRDAPLNGHGAFHGYWTEGLSGVEPRFGSERDLRRLRRQLDRRDMRLVLDVVWNHVGYDTAMTRARPDWFHGRGDVVDWADPTQRVTHDVHGLPDLAQEQEQVYRWLFDQTYALVDAFQPDGLRIDAVGHMPLTFQARMAEELRAGLDPDLWLLGEAFEGDAAKLAKTLQGSGFSAVFDFPLHYAMTDVFCKDRPVGRLASTLSLDRVYGDALAERPGALVTFLDNHDTARLLGLCGGDVTRAQQALLFQMSARGTPSVTWGTEIGLAGTGEPENRADMRFDVDHPLGDTLAWAVALRRAHPALRAPDTLNLSLDGGLYQLVRVAPEELALVVVNRRDEAFSLPIPARLAQVARPVSGVVLGSDGQPRALPEPLDPDEPLPVPGRATLILFLKPLAPDALAPLIAESRAPALREIQLTVELPLAEGERLIWVGAAPELGAWDPARGVAFQDGKATCSAPVGGVLAGKLVIQRQDGSFTWEQGEDRYLFVPPGEGALKLGSRWRDPASGG